jgi:hypothetical protein
MCSRYSQKMVPRVFLKFVNRNTCRGIQKHVLRNRKTFTRCLKKFKGIRKSACVKNQSRGLNYIFSRHFQGLRQCFQGIQNTSTFRNSEQFKEPSHVQNNSLKDLKIYYWSK